MTSHAQRPVEVAQCDHCGARILNPTSDECPACKCEVYPVSRIVQPGSYVLAGKLHDANGEAVMNMGKYV